MRITLKFLFLLLCTKIVFSQEDGKSTIDKIGDGLACAKSGIVIAQTAHLLFKYANPGPVEELRQLLLNQQIKILKTEEELLACVAINAYGNRKEDELPIDCDETARSFAEVAGLVRHDVFRLEFNSTMEDLPLVSKKQSENQGMSGSTKVIIGGAIVIGAAGIFLIAAPDLLPATVISEKARAIITSIKTSSSAFNKLPAIDKIKVTAKVIGAAEFIHGSAQYVRPYVFENAQEELIRLTSMREKRPSLRDRIKEVHFPVNY